MASPNKISSKSIKNFSSCTDPPLDKGDPVKILKPNYASPWISHQKDKFAYQKKKIFYFVFNWCFNLSFFHFHASPHVYNFHEVIYHSNFSTKKNSGPSHLYWTTLNKMQTSLKIYETFRLAGSKCDPKHPIPPSQVTEARLTHHLLAALSFQIAVTPPLPAL